MTGKVKKNPRLAAALAVERVVYRGQQLNRTLDTALSGHEAADKRLIAEIVNGVTRWFWLLDSYVSSLVARPLRRKDRDVHSLLLTGLYQLEFTRVPSHACVNETVQAVRELGKSWAGPFLNAVMREFLSNRDEHCEQAESDDSARYSHPAWMIQVLKQQWPDHWSKILQANNSKPEMFLRVNTSECSVREYLDILASHDIPAVVDSVSPFGIRLQKRVHVEQLPEFGRALVSVQNPASQLVAPLMDIQPGHRVLDACSAPGGKLLHMLDLHPSLQSITAVDIDEDRCAEIVDNLERAGRYATVVTADASQPDTWWDGKLFDRILIDAPCSATGIISKHPDIKHHRQTEDIENSVSTQSNLLEALLPLLDEHGKLIYTTCSIFREENEGQVSELLQRYPEFVSEMLPESLGLHTGNGYQRLQGVHDGDGFFYAVLRHRMV